MEIYKILETILAEKDITIAEASRICKISDSTLRGIITRKQKSIALEVAFKISKGLNISLEKLNGNYGKAPNQSVKNDNVNLSSVAMSVAKAFDASDDLTRAMVMRTLNIENQTGEFDIAKDIKQTVSSVLKTTCQSQQKQK